MEILLILFIIFIVFPLVRVLFSVGKTVHTFRKTYKEQTDAFRQAQQRADQSYADSQTTSKKTRDSKKRRAIDFFKKSSEDAEYVEIKGERSPQPDIDTKSSSSSAKPRVSDAQFEDIK